MGDTTRIPITIFPFSINRLPQVHRDRTCCSSSVLIFHVLERDKRSLELWYSAVCGLWYTISKYDYTIEQTRNEKKSYLGGWSVRYCVQLSYQTTDNVCKFPHHLSYCWDDKFQNHEILQVVDFRGFPQIRPSARMKERTDAALVVDLLGIESGRRNVVITMFKLTERDARVIGGNF